MPVMAKPAGRHRQGAFLALLVLPLVVFVFVVFLWPVARFLALSVDNSDISGNLPRTIAALSDWEPETGLPAEPVFVALVEDLADAKRNGQDGVLAQLVNQRVVGTRFLIIKTSRTQPTASSTCARCAKACSRNMPVGTIPPLAGDFTPEERIHRLLSAE